MKYLVLADKNNDNKIVMKTFEMNDNGTQFELANTEEYDSDYYYWYKVGY